MEFPFYSTLPQVLFEHFPALHGYELNRDTYLAQDDTLMAFLIFDPVPVLRCGSRPHICAGKCAAKIKRITTLDQHVKRGRMLVTRVTGIISSQIGCLGSTRAPVHAVRLAAAGYTVTQIILPANH